MQTTAFKEMTIVKEPGTSPSLSTGMSILKAMAYFDIFKYPLTHHEIKQFLDQPVSETTLNITLHQLLGEKKIFRLFNYYSLTNDPVLAEKRIVGNQRAEKLLMKALKIGRFLFKFPFVKAIGISGSLSKQYADEKADIDFFVITKANRLWIARTIMHLFKKITFLTGRQHYYCMNYYIDEAALQLQDKDIFTAVELKTLLPVCGGQTMNHFFEANEWSSEMLPACMFRDQQTNEPRYLWLKKSIEWMSNNRMGEWMDDRLMAITSRRWKKKENKGKRNNKGQTMCMVTGKHFAWMNPDSFNKKVLSMYYEKLDELKSTMPEYFIDFNPSFEV